LQNAAIAETRDSLLASGWSQVHVLEPGTRLDTWDYESATKADGGAVYIEVEGDGHVTIRKGLRPKRKGARQHGRGASEADEGSTVAERPEMTQALASYVDLVRHSAVRLAVASTPKVALRLLVAHAMGGAKWWKVEPERQTPHSEAIGAAIASLPTHAAFAALREEAASTLGLDSDTGTLVANDGCGARTAAVFVKLLEMPDKDLNRLLAVVMAETLAAGTALIDTLGQQLAVDVGAAWQPDEMFFGLLRDRESTGAMLAEMIGKRAADSYLTATDTAKKDIMRKALAGDGRSKVTGWLHRRRRNLVHDASESVYVRVGGHGSGARPRLSRNKRYRRPSLSEASAALSPSRPSFKAVDALRVAAVSVRTQACTNCSANWKLGCGCALVMHGRERRARAPSPDYRDGA
jgi:ParB family chromosome partitioning protein